MATPTGFDRPVTDDQDSGAARNSPDASPIRNDRVPLPGDWSPALAVTTSLTGGSQSTSVTHVAAFRTPPRHTLVNGTQVPPSHESPMPSPSPSSWLPLTTNGQLSTAWVIGL